MLFLMLHVLAKKKHCWGWGYNNADSKVTEKNLVLIDYIYTEEEEAILHWSGRQE